MWVAKETTWPLLIGTVSRRTPARMGWSAGREGSAPRRPDRPMRSADGSRLGETRPRRLSDQAGGGRRVGDVDGVAAGRLGDGGSDPLRHRALRRRRNHSVVACDEIPAWLAPPGGLADDAVGPTDTPQHLRVR